VAVEHSHHVADTSEADKAAKKAEDEAKRKEEERIAAEKRLAEQTQQIQRETIDASLELMQDGIEKEKKIQENRFSNEIADLEAQKVNKETLTAAEIAFNDSIDKLIETKREQHNKALADIDKKYTEESTEFKMQKLDEEAALQLAIANQTINDEEKLAEERKKIAADLAQAKLDLINAEIAATGKATEDQIQQLKDLQAEIDKVNLTGKLTLQFEALEDFNNGITNLVNDGLANLAVGIGEGFGAYVEWHR
jgi:DNA repair exonuclease SbcCD ATPase subunit